MHDVNQNTSKRKKKFQTLSPAIYIEGWGKHFEHEYMIKPSKNLIEP